MISLWDKRHQVFIGRPLSQKLGYAAWLVECVIDEVLQDQLPEDIMTELTRAHGILREQQGKALKRASDVDVVCLVSDCHNFGKPVAGVEGCC
jgi:hypothetical protein